MEPHEHMREPNDVDDTENVHQNEHEIKESRESFAGEFVGAGSWEKASPVAELQNLSLSDEETRQGVAAHRAKRQKAPDGAKLELAGEAGFHRLPDQVIKKAVKNGFDFNIMIIGESSSGKTTLLESLFMTALEEAESTHMRDNVEVMERIYEIVEQQVKVRLRVAEVFGFGDQLRNDNSIEPATSYIMEQFEKYLREETSTIRTLHEYNDTRVHLCIYVVSPNSHGLRPIDIQALRALTNVVNVVPVIGKADSLTKEDTDRFKKMIADDLKRHNITCYELPMPESGEEVDETFRANKVLQAFAPYAVCGSRHIDDKGRRVRDYVWGKVDIENENHSDLVRLREAVIRLNMTDLWKKAHEKFYFDFRLSRLPGMGLAPTESDLAHGEVKELEDKVSKLQQEQQRTADSRQQEIREQYTMRFRAKEAEIQARQKAIEAKNDSEIAALEEQLSQYKEKAATAQRELQELCPVSSKGSVMKLTKSLFRSSSTSGNSTSTVNKV